MESNSATPELSVILPVYNEESCVADTIRELAGLLRTLSGGHEILAVDDGSTDGTPAILKALREELPVLRVITLSPNAGQSAAFGAGFRAARGATIVTMDADGQNDPASIPALLEALKECDAVCGFRAQRQDTAAKRWGSRLANRVRQAVLHDGIVDTGCTLKAFRRWVVQDLAMWKGMHRFLPVLAQMKGATIRQIPVPHRPRTAGQSKYTNWGRLRQTLWDLWAVRWMQKRNPRFTVKAE